MKYFTLSWWAGETENEHAFDDYRHYLTSVIGLLPADLRRFSVDVSLHDAHLRRLNLVDNTLELHLDGYRFDEASRAYFGRRLRLTYQGVCTLTSTADPKAGMVGPHGYGDLGYDELEVIEAGVYEHRMLFSSGIELQVRFSEFSLWYEDDVV